MSLGIPSRVSKPEQCEPSKGLRIARVNVGTKDGPAAEQLAHTNTRGGQEGEGRLLELLGAEQPHEPGGLIRESVIGRVTAAEQARDDAVDVDGPRHVTGLERVDQCRGAGERVERHELVAVGVAETRANGERVHRARRSDRDPSERAPGERLMGHDLCVPRDPSALRRSRRARSHIMASSSFVSARLFSRHRKRPSATLW